MPVAVRELELDLDAFEGPFDLLLSLVLRDELPLRELDLADPRAPLVLLDALAAPPIDRKRPSGRSSFYPQIR